MAENHFGGFPDDSEPRLRHHVFPFCIEVNDWRRAVEPRSAVVKVDHPAERVGLGLI